MRFPQRRWGFHLSTVRKHPHPAVHRSPISALSPLLSEVLRREQIHKLEVIAECSQPYPIRPESTFVEDAHQAERCAAGPAFAFLLGFQNHQAQC